MNIRDHRPARRTLTRALLGAALVCMLTPLQAQSWPARPIKFIVPYAAGGTTDIMARVVAEKLAVRLGQPVIVDNRGGAGGITGTDQALKSPADGYTFLFALATTMLVNQFLYEKLPYNPLKDQTPISQIAVGPLVLMVNPQLPVNNAPELMQYLERHRGKVAYGSWGMGSTAHLDGAWLSHKLNAELTHVAYRGEAPMMQDLVGGQIQMAFATLQTARSFIDGGRLKPLAVTGGEHLAALPKVPTLFEQGIDDELFRVTGWLGLSAPARLAADIQARMAADVKAVLALPEVRDRFQQMGFIAVGNSPEQFAAAMKKEAPSWERLVKLSGAKLD